jgi:hypothetical protein
MLPVQIGLQRAQSLQSATQKAEGALGKERDELKLQQLAGNKATTKALEAKEQQGKVPEKAEAKDAQSAFAMLAGPLNVLVPSPGTRATLQVEFRIPAKGAVITLRVKGEAAKQSESSFSLALEAAVGAGGHLGVAMAKGEVGGFLETRGPDAKGALTLASWSLFRSLLAESAVVPQELVEALYATKEQSSDEWDKQVRKTYFAKGSESSAQVGTLVGAEASGQLMGVASVKGGVQAKLGRLYNAETIERRADALSTSQKLLGSVGIKRGAQASVGDRFVTVIATGECDVVGGITGGSVQVTTTIRQEKDKRGAKETTRYVLDTLSCEGTITTKLIPLSEIASLGGASGVMATKLVALVKAAKKALSKAEEKVKESESAQTSASVGDALWSMAAMRDGLEVALKEAGSLDISIPSVVSTGQLHLTAGLVERQAVLTVALENLMKVEIPDIVVAHASFERLERVASIEFDGSRWVAHFGDLDKELAAKDKAKKAPLAPSSAPSAPLSGAKGTGNG